MSIFFRIRSLAPLTHLGLIAVLSMGLAACGGQQAEAEGPTEAELERKAALENCDPEEALLASDEAIDDGFDEEAGFDEETDQPEADAPEQM